MKKVFKPVFIYIFFASLLSFIVGMFLGFRFVQRTKKNAEYKLPQVHSLENKSSYSCTLISDFYNQSGTYGKLYQTDFFDSSSVKALIISVEDRTLKMTNKYDSSFSDFLIFNVPWNVQNNTSKRLSATFYSIMKVQDIKDNVEDHTGTFMLDKTTGRAMLVRAETRMDVSRISSAYSYASRTMLFNCE